MRKIIIITFIFTLFLSSHSIAQISTGSNFLKLGIGPRQVGLGSAFTGVGDDVYTIYWNPGGLGLVRRWEISAMYNNYFADMYYGALTGVKQFRILGSRKTTAGIGLFFHGMPDWDSTEGQVSEKGSASNTLLVGSFGQRMDWLTKNLSAGINAKIGYSELANYDAWTLATDIGLMYRMEVWNKPLSLGLAVQNIGFQTAFVTEKAPIPLGFRFGASYRISKCDNHSLLIASDLSKYKYGNLKLGFGAEYWFRGFFGVRGGYSFNQDNLGDISFGASIGLDAFNAGSQFDYSQSDYGNTLDYDRNFDFSVHSVSPEPFRLFEPASGEVFCNYDVVFLTWENSEDPDWCDQITYRILLDPRKNEIENAVTQVCQKPETKTKLAFEFSTNDTEFQIPQDIPPAIYYWTIIAVDKKGHTCWCRETRAFVKSAPDLLIKDIAFEHTRTLPDLNDDFQGRIRIVVENPGLCKGYDFKIELYDSFYCERMDAFKEKFLIDSIDARSSITRYYPWYTNDIGKHRFSAIVDPDNNVEESNENNNQNSCLAITIPRGRVCAEKDTLDTKKIVFTYSEIPIVPIVFFDENTDSVGEDFYVEDPIRPVPMLKVIADRLNQYKNFKIELAGYIDPIGEKGQEKLAQQRAQNVYSILLNYWGAPKDRVKLKNDHIVTKRRVERTPDDMVNAENRRVEIEFDSVDSTEIFQLFGPIEIVGIPQISDGLAFTGKVKAFVDITCWQLILQDAEKKQTVYRTPFKIDPASETYDMQDRTVWIGNNNENNLVELNRLYEYQMKIQDRFGRDYLTRPKKFYLKCDFIEKQQLQVHLDEFDSSVELLKFGHNRLTDLASILCSSDSIKIKFSGYACEIGTREYNLNLAHKRAKDSRIQFLKILTDMKKQHDSTKVQQILSIKELDKKFGYPGNYAEPLKYYNPCTLKEYIFPLNNAYGRNLSRRVDIILFKVEKLQK